MDNVSKDEFLRARRKAADHAADTANPHNVTKAQVGLGNVPNAAPIPYDGWIPAEAWTRTANNAFTVAGDVTNKYQAKDKFKLMQDGSVKYGYFVKTAYNGGITTINTSLETALTAADIADPYYSKMANPQGFLYDAALLWNGSWSGGNITVPGIANFKQFIVWLDGQGTALNVNTHDGLATIYWRGMGGFINDTPTIITYQIAATLSADTLTMVNCQSVIHSASGGHSAYTARTAVRIYGSA